MIVHPTYALLARATPKPLRGVAHRILHHRLGPGFALDLQAFRDRRVLIVGPARTVEDDLAELGCAGFDTVVRMNNGLDTPIAAVPGHPYRCDVLFHCLTAETRPVAPENLRRAGVRLIVHRLPTRGDFLRTVAFAGDLPPATDLRIAPLAHHRALCRRLGGFAPTTGLVCASLLLASPAQAVGIAGFTFFTTRYVPDYDARDRTDAETRQRVRARGHHSPEREARLLMQLVDEARARGMEVMLGPGILAAAARVGEALPGCDGAPAGLPLGGTDRRAGTGNGRRP